MSRYSFFGSHGSDAVHIPIGENLPFCAEKIEICEKYICRAGLMVSGARQNRCGTRHFADVMLLCSCQGAVPSAAAVRMPFTYPLEKTFRFVRMKSKFVNIFCRVGLMAISARQNRCGARPFADATLLCNCQGAVPLTAAVRMLFTYPLEKNFRFVRRKSEKTGNYLNEPTEHGCGYCSSGMNRSHIRGVTFTRPEAPSAASAHGSCDLQRYDEESPNALPFPGRILFPLPARS